LGYIEIAVFMIILPAGCKYHSFQSIVNMKLEWAATAGGVICFKSNVIYGILFNHFICHWYYMLPPELLQILACPACKGELTRSEDGSSLLCKPCNRMYPVIEEIPVLLPDAGSALPTQGKPT
jgi:uncharacterized protein YbaR (Trm112 family)